MRKCHYECLYFSSYSSKAVLFYPAHMILQSVHRVIQLIWYLYPYLPPKSSKFLFPGIQILISQYFPVFPSISRYFPYTLISREIANPALELSLNQ